MFSFKISYRVYNNQICDPTFHLYFRDGEIDTQVFQFRLQYGSQRQIKYFRLTHIENGYIFLGKSRNSGTKWTKYPISKAARNFFKDKGCVNIFKVGRIHVEDLSEEIEIAFDYILHPYTFSHKRPDISLTYIQKKTFKDK